jgi:hypothetical protein
LLAGQWLDAPVVEDQQIGLQELPHQADVAAVAVGGAAAQTSPLPLLSTRAGQEGPLLTEGDALLCGRGSNTGI